MKHELIVLPYPANALEPVISATTINLHHGKHLATYVNNLNNLIQGTKFENADLETIVRESDGALFNNAGQTLNHNYYFTQFAPKSEGRPSGRLLKAIEEAWGGRGSPPRKKLNCRLPKNKMQVTPLPKDLNLSWA